MDTEFFIYTDGGSINNTYAACAFIITNKNNEVLYSNSVYLGSLTNNGSECNGVIFSLLSALSGGIRSNVVVYSDSQLTINQINGVYQIKATHLIPYHETIKYLSKQFEGIAFKWVPREHPMISACDKLCDQCIDQYRK